jgi:hypothetical protein
VSTIFSRKGCFANVAEEIIKELVFWGFFSQANNAAEIEEAVYLPTQKLIDYAQVFKDLLDGEIDKVESYRTRN